MQKRWVPTIDVVEGKGLHKMRNDQRRKYLTAATAVIMTLSISKTRDRELLEKGERRVRRTRAPDGVTALKDDGRMTRTLLKTV
jgi:hypothetical protein